MMALEFYSLPRVAEILGVSVKTIRRRIAAGKLAAFQDGPGRAYRVPASALARYVRERTVNREVA